MFQVTGRAQGAFAAGVRAVRTGRSEVKPSKCSFLRKEVVFLGHVIATDGVSPDPAKTEEVPNYPVPVDVSGVRLFLGLASYYRRFVPGFSKIAAPLYGLTKKSVAFSWSDECPVLAYPLFGPQHKFIVETDASVLGLGAVLSQKQANGHTHPIAYASRSLHMHKKNYGITDLETLALVWAVNCSSCTC